LLDSPWTPGWQTLEDSTSRGIIFVLISQNHMAAKDRIRADIEYDVNLKAEPEVAQLHEKVDHLQADVLATLARIERFVSRLPA
jgi:uncharacterized membrane protein